MSCGCHGKSGISVGRTSPYDQCTACAKKHVVKAWSLFNEFSYADDNRDAMTGQLRLAADHLMYDHVETARMARDLCALNVSLPSNIHCGAQFQHLRYIFPPNRYRRLIAIL